MFVYWSSHVVDGDALDPYLRWAQASVWRSVLRHTGEVGAPASLRLIASLPADQVGAIDRLPCKVPPLYASAMPVGGRLHFTADADFAQLPALLANPCDLRWELAVPFRDAEQRSMAQPVGLTGKARHPDTFRLKAPLPVDVPRTVPSSTPRGAIAVIDFGCPFLNERFEDGDGGTRIAALWDQGASCKPGVPLWRPARHGLQGRELGRAEINTLLALVRNEHPEWDELRSYKKLDHLIDYDDARRRVWGHTHGAHVLDLAGGRVDPLTGEADAASSADLLFVQLPALTASDASGASLAAQVLDAVRWCMDMVPQDLPLVVNISYGGQAGPHNRTGMLERALDALLMERKKQFAIVMGAGNAGGQRIHAHRLVKPNHSGLFGILVAPQDATDSFVECWYQPEELKGSAQLLARARAADGPWSDWVPAGHEVLLMDARGEAIAMVRHALNPPNGSGGMLLLAMAPTMARTESADPVAPAGRWELEWTLEGALSHPPVRVDAWVERDDPGAYANGNSITLEGADVDDLSDCLSNIAGGEYTVTVGGFCRSTGETMPYSSRSATKNSREKLFVRAACEDSTELQGFTAAAVRSLEAHRMNGTSVASPVLARRLYNRMVKRGAPPVTRGTMAKALREIVLAERRASGGPAVRE